MRLATAVSVLSISLLSALAANRIHPPKTLVAYLSTVTTCLTSVHRCARTTQGQGIASTADKPQHR